MGTVPSGGIISKTQPFPQEFIEPPVVLLTPDKDSSYNYSANTRARNTVRAIIQVYNGAPAEALETTLQWFAMGRWK